MKTRCILICLFALLSFLHQDSIYAADERTKAEEEKKETWKREISVGYDKTSGNTHTSQLTGGLFINRNRKHIDEITLKADTYYSSSERKMNAQKCYGLSRYAFSFGVDKKWYNFYKLEGDHDRFANIDYRLIPAAGVGYWLWDSSDLKAMVEAAVGWEHTNFCDNIKDSNEAILIPRGFFEKILFGKSKISQDIYLYPTLEDFGNYRLHSETTLTSPFTDSLSLRLSLIDDYNSNPPSDTKKNDIRIISSLMYSF